MSRDFWNKRYETMEFEDLPAPSSVLTETAKPLKPGKALVLAAGYGRNAFYLAKQGWRVTAVDFSAEAIAIGERFSSEQNLGIRWIEEDLTAYHPEQGGYNLVTIIYLHIPWDDFTGILRKAEAALAPGGTLLLIGHDSLNPLEGTGGPQNPKILYRPEDIMPFLSKVRIERAESYRMPVDHGENIGQGIQIDCVIRAVKPKSRTGI